ncbi:MAG: hypothetical protein HZT40_17765 [Candidatus Thiothrix singaporensis]|uniref:Uncharacterized protein n=1 Tax=Candidatus Thiothrix singaporensis TaxID=2799669 RepID=A0A7L6AVZ8_9GAMM|nr:MAG: hypothetical protein HZT40_17765 [Candidatus Thiothrix singaporensis]
MRRCQACGDDVVVIVGIPAHNNALPFSTARAYAPAVGRAGEVKSTAVLVGDKATGAWVMTPRWFRWRNAT